MKECKRSLYGRIYQSPCLLSLASQSRLTVQEGSKAKSNQLNQKPNVDISKLGPCADP